MGQVEWETDKDYFSVAFKSTECASQVWFNTQIIKGRSQF